MVGESNVKLAREGTAAGGEGSNLRRTRRWPFRQRGVNRAGNAVVGKSGGCVVASCILRCGLERGFVFKREKLMMRVAKKGPSEDGWRGGDITFKQVAATSLGYGGPTPPQVPATHLRIEA